MSADDRSAGDDVERLLAHVVALPEHAQEAAVAELCVRHAALAGALRDRFDGYRHLLAALAPDAGSAAIPATGTTFGEFELLRELGRGGMGIVYLARQQRADQSRLVALKLMRDQGLLSGRARERLRREAAAAFRLDDPGLCPVLDVGETDGVPWLLMRYVPGRTLAEHIAEGRARGAFELPAFGGDDGAGSTAPSHASSTQARRIDAALAIGEALARSLHRAHEAGFVHRDVKPGNVMIEPDGRPVLLDFGLVRDEASEQALTLSGEMLGTPAYMSPEQIDGGRGVDRTSDVWSLAATLWETMTSERPFDGRTREELFRAILQAEPGGPRRRGAALPRDVRTVLTTAMARRPEHRYATALEFAHELGRLRRREPILTRPPGLVRRAWLWAQRHPLAAALLAGLFVAVGAVAGIAVEASYAAELARAAEARAVRHLGSARRAVAELVRLQEEELTDVPGLEPLRREIQERALEFLDDVRAAATHTPDLLAQRADALLLAATLELSLGHAERADELHAEAERTLQDLGPHPAAAGLRSRWHLFRGERHRQRGELPAALAAFERSVQEAEHGDAGDPDRLQAMQMLRRCGALLRRTNDRAAAMAAVERGLALAERLADAAAADAVIAAADLLRLRGQLLHAADSTTDAARDYRASTQRLRTLLARTPDDRHAQAALADCRVLEASLLLGTGDLAERATALGEACQLFDRLAARFPAMPTYRSRLAAALTKAASVHDAEGKAADAIAGLERATALLRTLVAEQPEHVSHRSELAATLINLGNRRGADADAAEAMHLEALGLLEELLTRNPDEAEWHEGAARAGMSVAGACAGDGDARAAEHFAEARRHCEHVVRLRPEDWRSRQLRGVLLFNEGVFRAESGDLDAARPLLDAARHQAIDNLARAPRNAGRAADLLKWTVRRATVAALADAGAAAATWSEDEGDWNTIAPELQQQLLRRAASAFDHTQLRRGALAAAARRGDAAALRALEQVALDLERICTEAPTSGAALAERLLCLLDLAAAHDVGGTNTSAEAARRAAGELLREWRVGVRVDATTRRRLAAADIDSHVADETARLRLAELLRAK
jgi:eukaryotic-like serine/threonine-protein kinase